MGNGAVHAVPYPPLHERRRSIKHLTQWLIRLLVWLGIWSTDPPQPTRQQPQDPWDLEAGLIDLSPWDRITNRHVAEGVLIVGMTGSGKTSGSGATFAKRYLEQGYGGMVLCAKPEECGLWLDYLRQSGRLHDAIVVSPSQPYRHNFLDHEISRGGRGAGQVENVVEMLAYMTEFAEGKVQVGGGDPYWGRAMKEMLRKTITLFTLTGEPLTLEAISQVITTAPQDAEQAGDTGWQETSYCAQLLAQAEEAVNNATAAHDFHLTARYWLEQFPALSSRTRSSVVSTYSSTADILMHGTIWELFGTSTNWSPEDAFAGKVIILDLPVQEFFEAGRICQGIAKRSFQRAMLARDVRVHPRPCFLWIDEAQMFVAAEDARYQAVARSARACTVLLTQNISNFYSVMGSRDATHGLWGNMGLKIFHANSDHSTNQYAADLIGQSWTTTHSYSSGGRDASGQHSHSASGSESVQYKVLPSRFMTLKTGGLQNGLEVEGIVVQGGRVWQANQDTWLPVIFKQQRLR